MDIFSNTLHVSMNEKNQHVIIITSYNGKLMN
jgi:hypothetical protein